MNRVASFALVFVAACFNPTFHNPTCGPNGECPSGTSCVDGICRAPGSTDDAAVEDAGDDALAIDAMPDAAPTCLGTGAWQMCAAVGTQLAAVTLSSALNTDTASECISTVDWSSASQPDACVVARVLDERRAELFEPVPAREREQLLAPLDVLAVVLAGVARFEFQFGRIRRRYH